MNLFIVAGHTCSGKSTLIKESYRRNIPIFGPVLDLQFRATNISDDIEEYKCFETALSKRTFFQAMHIPQLRTANISWENVLIHLDLNAALRKLFLASSEESSFLADIGLNRLRSGMDLLNSAENDQLMILFLRDTVFDRFSSVHVATVNCDAKENYRRSAARSGRTLKADTPVIYLELHSEIYRCWEAGLATLKPHSVCSIDTTVPDRVLRNGQAIGL